MRNMNEIYGEDWRKRFRFYKDCKKKSMTANTQILKIRDFYKREEDYGGNKNK